MQQYNNSNKNKVLGKEVTEGIWKKFDIKFQGGVTSRCEC